MWPLCKVIESQSHVTDYTHAASRQRRSSTRHPRRAASVNQATGNRASAVGHVISSTPPTARQRAGWCRAAIPVVKPDPPAATSPPPCADLDVRSCNHTQRHTHSERLSNWHITRRASVTRSIRRAVRCHNLAVASFFFFYTGHAASQNSGRASYYAARIHRRART